MSGELHANGAFKMSGGGLKTVVVLVGLKMVGWFHCGL